MNGLDRAAAGLVDAALAPSTRRAYNSAWASFESFCTASGLCPLPATVQTIGRWLAARAVAGSGGSARRDLAAVRDAHIAARLPDLTGDPWLQRLTTGALRVAARSRPPRPPRAALPASVVQPLLLRSEYDVIALRDATLISVGLALMRRAAELAALDVGDVHLTNTGATISIRRSKTDQAGVGLALPVDASVALLLRRWLRVRPRLAAPAEGALFVSAQGARLSTPAVGSIVKRAAALAGLQGHYSAHSLRIGGASAALAAGASLAQIQAVGGWSSDAVRRYLRPSFAASTGGL